MQVLRKKTSFMIIVQIVSWGLQIFFYCNGIRWLYSLMNLVMNCINFSSAINDYTQRRNFMLRMNVCPVFSLETLCISEIDNKNGIKNPRLTNEYLAPWF